MDWQLLLNEIKERYPFLEKAGFGFEETEHFPMPPLLAIGSFAAINAIGDDSAFVRLAMIFPHSGSVACFIAAAASLASIKNQVQKGLPPLPDLNAGEKVLLNGADFTFLGKVMDKNQLFFKFAYAGTGKIKLLPVTDDNRLLIQHSVSSRQLAKRDRKPIESVVDPLLNAKLRGNTSLFQTSVILISRVYAVREQVSGLNVAADKSVCSGLASLFGWGSLTEEGEVKIWGSGGRREEPLVLVSSNFADVCEYLEYNSHKTELIIIDGTSYLKDAASFETLLNKKLPIIFVLSGKDTDGVRYLKRKDFSFWAWNSDDLRNLQNRCSETAESPFYQLSKKIASFGSFDVNTVECANPALDGAFDLMNYLRYKITEEDFHASQILDRVFMHFLRASRLVSTSNAITEKSEKDLSVIESDLRTFRWSLEPEIFELFAETVKMLKQAVVALSDEDSKPARLRSEIGRLLKEGCEKICVVLSKSDFQTEKEYLNAVFPGKKVSTERSASFKMRDDYDCVILCGYLKRAQMLRIFDEAINARLTILNYAHEKQHTDSVKKQFFGAFDNREYRNYRVFGKNLPVSEMIGTPARKAEPTYAPALEEFEIKLHEFKRRRILKSIGEDSGAKKESARCVTFNQGGFAFLTESYSVPVINALLGGKTKVEGIPQKKVKDIQPGDFLLFRESGGRNLIREIADSGLSKSGKSELRNTASRWRETLTKIYESNDRSLLKVKAELKKYDCDRNELTIKNWLFDENQIAPGEDSDILAIAAAADDDELLKTYDDLIEAISQVRGAHLQAAKQVARLLEKRVKGDLGDLEDSHAEITVSGLGKVFVVCVESVDTVLAEVPGHKTNRLLKEKERDDGANDSALSVG